MTPEERAEVLAAFARGTCDSEHGMEDEDEAALAKMAAFAIRSAVVAEREECAKIAYGEAAYPTAKRIAELIRARKS